MLWRLCGCLRSAPEGAAASGHARGQPLAARPAALSRRGGRPPARHPLEQGGTPRRTRTPHQTAEERNSSHIRLDGQWRRRYVDTLKMSPSLKRCGWLCFKFKIQHTLFDLISGRPLNEFFWPQIFFWHVIFFLNSPYKRTLNVRARLAIRPVYSKLVLPSQKSLEIIINIKINLKKITNNKKIRKMGGVR